MKLVKKATVIATAAAMLMTLGASSAMAKRHTDPDPDNGNEKVTICHKTGSASNPWVELEISENAWETPDTEDPNGHGNHEDDFEVDEGHPCPPEAEEEEPPAEEEPPVVDEDEAGKCEARSREGDSTSTQKGLINVGNIGVNLGNLGANALCQSNVLNGLTAAVLGKAVGGDGAGGAGGGECEARSRTGNSTSDQKGLVNVGNIDVSGGNLLANAACQSDILNGLTAAVLGTAVGGDGAGGAGGGECEARSRTGDSDSAQKGLVNVGNVGVDGGNAAANLLCQSNVLNDVTLAVLGTAFAGGDHDGDHGMFDGGLLGLLDVDGGLLAKVAFIF